MVQLTKRAKEEVIPTWGVGILESHHAPDFEMDWRRHNFLKLIYVLSGEGTISVGNASFRFQQQDLMVVPVGAKNRLVDAPNRQVSIYVLCISRSVLEFDRSIERRLPAGIHHCDSSVAIRAEHLLRNLLFHQKHLSNNTRLEMVTSALRFLQLLFRDSTMDTQTRSGLATKEDEMSRYVLNLDTHFFEAGDITTAAASLGMSRRAFTDHFRRATGKSWLEYVRERSILYSQELLRDTDAPIAAIAFECGFKDLSTFYRQFKRRVGVSPLAWRKNK